MNRQLLKAVAVLLGMVVITLVLKSIILQGLSLVELGSAPPLAGVVSQSLGRPGSKTELPVAGKDYTLRDTRYFNNGQWAAATIVPTQSNGDTVIVIMQKINGTYQVVLGPANEFSSSYLYTLPPELSQYLSQKGVLHV